MARIQKLGLFAMQQKLLILTLLTKASTDNAERSVCLDFQIVNERGEPKENESWLRPLLVIQSSEGTSAAQE